MKNLNLKKNQVIIFVIALMLVTAGYLNFNNQQKDNQNLIPTSSLADSEQIADIGDATLVNANQTTENKVANEEKNGNIVNNQTNVGNNEITSDNSYFTQSKLDRDKMYSQMIENYQKILETDNLTSDEKNNAQAEIKRINNEKNAIMISENLIKTKGFEDVILFVNNGNVSVIIKSSKLKEEQIAQIQNIITRELNVKVNKINVSVK